MKKRIAFTMTVLMLLLTCASLSSCGRRNNSIDFGEKYISRDMENGTYYYVFRANGTGYMECDYTREASGYTYSGKIDFEWREASDGAVYLFEVEITRNANDSGKDLPFVQSGIYFGDGFFVSVSSGQYGDYVRYFVREGSGLDKDPNHE